MASDETKPLTDEDYATDGPVFMAIMSYVDHDVDPYWFDDIGDECRRVDRMIRERDAENARLSARVEELTRTLELTDEEWICPECESIDTKEFAYHDDFGSRVCNDCGHAGEPGEDFPTIIKSRRERDRIREENARLSARVAELEETLRSSRAVYEEGYFRELLDQARETIERMWPLEELDVAQECDDEWFAAETWRALKAAQRGERYEGAADAR